jgi:hypothetical protein
VIGGVLVIALGIGGVVFLVSGKGEDDPDTTRALPSVSAPVEPSDGPTAEPSADAPEPRPGDGPYIYVDDFCEQLDFQPVFDVLPYEDGPDVSEYEFAASQEKECRYDLTDGSSFGNSGTRATTFTDAESAQVAFESTVGITDEFNEEREDAEGWWDVGYLYFDSSIDSSVELLVRHDNLMLSVRLFIAGDARDREAQAAALLTLAEDARAILSA